jgi:hypothetical protein
MIHAPSRCYYAATTSSLPLTTATWPCGLSLGGSGQRIQVQLIHASTEQREHQMYTIGTELQAALHTQRGETGVNVLCNMLVAPPGWSSGAATAHGAVADTAAASTTASTATDIVKYLQSDDGVDFSELGFECVLLMYYGTVDTDKLRATLQAAQFFGLATLAAAAKQFAQASSGLVQ